MPAVSPTLLAVLTIGVVALILGVLIGSYALPPVSYENQIKLNILKQFTENRYLGSDDPIVKRFNEEVSRERLRQNLKFISSEPHLPGSGRDEELAHFIRKEFIAYGLDRAYLVPYNVLLSYSNQTHPNKVYVIDGQNVNNIFFESKEREVAEREDEMRDNFVDSYNSFAPKADVIGEPVFCNYGRQRDFDLLQNYAKIDLNGKICIIRYGKIFRGNKCDNAAQRGCIGVILYSDPLEMAREGTQRENLYPHSWWMSGRAMQRGNIRTSMGDALTPGFPALVDSGAFHYRISDVELPTMPTQPIGYEDALSILKLMGGIPVPNVSDFSDWNGGLNITYRLGPGFNIENANKKLRLVVNNVLKNKTIYNVIGILEGSVEPDRYVILGNHRDAWGYGALDAASGTTALLEVTRLFGHFHKESDWRPRRTLVFGSWTGEEFGLIGSTEWVEEHINLLSAKAVTYINVDTCVKGPHLSPDASPALMEIIRKVTEYIPFRNNTLLNAWIEYQEYISGELDRPKIKTLGSGTDHAPFAFFAGIPSINIEFTFDKKKYPISGYPAYHTGYETFHLVENFIDPDFSLHQTCAQLIGVLMQAISGSTLIPVRMDELANRVDTDYQNMWKEDRNRFISKKEFTSPDNKPTIDLLEKSIKNFVKAAKEWMEELKNVDQNNPLLVRHMNDVAMGVERAFITPQGLEDRPEIRNILYAPFRYNKYSTVVFPGFVDLMKKISDKQRTDASNVHKLWQSLRRHISDIAIALRSATNLLKRSPL